jgi:hypothetical protein
LLALLRAIPAGRLNKPYLIVTLLIPQGSEKHYFPASLRSPILDEQPYESPRIEWEIPEAKGCSQSVMQYFLMAIMTTNSNQPGRLLANKKPDSFCRRWLLAVRLCSDGANTSTLARNDPNAL